MRRFHSYGPVDCRYHFCVDRQTLVERCIDQLVGIPDQGGHYFTIWAPRQTGKTWLMRQMREEIPQRYGDQFTDAFRPKCPLLQLWGCKGAGVLARTLFQLRQFYTVDDAA
jgi:hypothetical protein